MDWTDIFKTVATNTVFLAVIGFVAKSVFNHFLSKDIEKYRIELQATSERELERLRADLDKTAFEHQTRFANLHAKRAEVIAELYNRLVQAERDVNLMASPFEFSGEPSHEEKFTKAHSSGKSLFEYFECNRIYFSRSLCDRVANFTQELHSAIANFREVVRIEHGGVGGKEKLENWEKAWKKINQDIPPIKSEIEGEFRKMLGISDQG
jgi:hypothetical protein